MHTSLPDFVANLKKKKTEFGCQPQASRAALAEEAVTRTATRKKTWDVPLGLAPSTAVGPVLRPTLPYAALSPCSTFFFFFYADATSAPRRNNTATAARSAMHVWHHAYSPANYPASRSTMHVYDTTLTAQPFVAFSSSRCPPRSPGP